MLDLAGITHKVYFYFLYWLDYQSFAKGHSLVLLLLSLFISVVFANNMLFYFIEPFPVILFLFGSPNNQNQDLEIACLNFACHGIRYYKTLPCDLL